MRRRASTRTPNAPCGYGLTGEQPRPGYPAPAAAEPERLRRPPEEQPTQPQTGCQHGMVGTPPNCHCPKNSELLGGNCVHYTATMCQSELPVNVNPEPCQDVEAKLVLQDARRTD